MAIAILSSTELRRHLADGDGGYTVIDARHRDEYERGHIPGALWMGWEEWCESCPPHADPVLAQAGYWGVLADLPADAFARRLALHGVSSDRPLVVYADGPRSKGREGRIAWMLLYLGAAAVYLLDGGWRGWLAGGGAVETRRPSPLRGHFTPALQEQRRARLPYLKQAHQAGTLPLFIDTRDQAEFDGDARPYLPRQGRLPAAVLLPFADLFDAAEAYITREAYLERLPPEVRQARALVTYCEVGVRASLVALLHEIHTGQVVAVFDGSLMAWSLDAELPVHTREAGRQEAM